MSLNWNLEAIENHKEVCWIKTDEKGDDGEPRVRMNPVTETLIFMTMAVKLGSITEANADEFYARLKVIEKLEGPFMFKTEDGKKVDVYFTPEDVQAHIGLACNVSNETTTKFFSGLRQGLFKSHKNHYKAAMRQKEVVTT